MTSILDITLGNRGSGKTDSLFKDLHLNYSKQSRLPQVVVSPYYRNIEIKLQRLGLNKGPVQSVNPDQAKISLRGLSNYYLYIDDADKIQPDTLNYIIDFVQIDSRCKGFYFYTTPSFLRDPELLDETNIKPTGDPLIRILRIADFKFKFLFNPKTADLFINTSFSDNIVLTEGFGLLTSLD